MSSDHYTWNDALRDAAQRLDQREARLIVGHVAEYSAAEMAIHGDEKCNERCQTSINNRIDRRLNGEPLQYVLGSWGFRQLDLFIDTALHARDGSPDDQVAVLIIDLDRFKNVN